uniref:Uncharacterized protein n=1 Tax=Anguilla anguilla TaxID=7936 RepID=A0A0E9U9J0_ANGAN
MMGTKPELYHRFEQSAFRFAIVPGFHFSLCDFQILLR